MQGRADKEAELSDCLKSAHDFLTLTQVKDNPPSHHYYYRQTNKVRCGGSDRLLSCRQAYVDVQWV